MCALSVPISTYPRAHQGKRTNRLHVGLLVYDVTTRTRHAPRNTSTMTTRLVLSSLVHALLDKNPNTSRSNFSRSPSTRSIKNVAISQGPEEGALGAQRKVMQFRSLKGCCTRHICNTFVEGYLESPSPESSLEVSPGFCRMGRSADH